MVVDRCLVLSERLRSYGPERDIEVYLCSFPVSQVRLPVHDHFQHVRTQTCLHFSLQSTNWGAGPCSCPNAQ